MRRSKRLRGESADGSVSALALLPVELWARVFAHVPTAHHRAVALTCRWFHGIVGKDWFRRFATPRQTRVGIFFAVESQNMSATHAVTAWRWRTNHALRTQHRDAHAMLLVSIQAFDGGRAKCTYVNDAWHGSAHMLMRITTTARYHTIFVYLIAHRLDACNYMSVNGAIAADDLDMSYALTDTGDADSVQRLGDWLEIEARMPRNSPEFIACVAYHDMMNQLRASV